MIFAYLAPTLSMPIHVTLIIKPTGSESINGLKQFCNAILTIFNERKEFEKGKVDKTDNVLKNAPHPQYEICDDEWKHSYSRQKAAFPTDWVKDNKFWIDVARIDNASGDRNLIACISCDQ